MSEDLQGIDRDRLAELHAAAEAAKTDDDQEAPSTAESPAQRRLREERERAAGVAKWDKRIKESVAKQRDMPPAPSPPDDAPAPESLPAPAVYATKADVPALLDAARKLDDSGEPIPLDVRLLESLTTAGALTVGPVRQITVGGQEHSDPECPAYQTFRRFMDSPGGRAAVLAEAIKRGSYDVTRSELGALQQLAAAKPPEDLFVRTAGGLVSLPAVGSEILGRRWEPVVEVEAVEVDGRPQAMRWPAPSIPPGSWVHHDGSPMFTDDGVIDPNGQLRLPTTTRYVRDCPLLLVARRQLTQYDYRGPLWADLRLAFVILFGTVGGISRWKGWEGAKLLARWRGGRKYPQPSTSDLRAWLSLWDFIDGVELPHRNRHGIIERLPLGRAEWPGDRDSTRVIQAPAWWLERAEGLKRYTLTNPAAPPRRNGLATAAREVVYAAEYLITTAYIDGDATMLAPVRSGGPGPWSRWYTWDRVLSELAGQYVDLSADTRAPRKRCQYLVDSLADAQYRAGAGHNGDVVEFDLRPGQGNRGSKLRFRSTPHLIEAARKSEKGKWRSTRLMEWL